MIWTKIIATKRSERLTNLAEAYEWNENEFSGTVWKRNGSPDIDLLKNDLKTSSSFSAKRLRANAPGPVFHGRSWELQFHPTENRLLTFREAARLMGFPDEWKLDEYQAKATNAFWFGKGVLVEVGRWIASAAYDALNKQPQAYSGKPIGEREYLIDAESEEMLEQDLPLFDLE